LKKSEAEVLVIAPPPVCLAGHQFPLEQIQFVIEKLVLAARTGLRGAARVCGIVAEFFRIEWETPHHTTARTWLLRIGLYQLMRPKERADDWVWIVDHTVQIGQEKCLIVLGIRLSQLPRPGECLRLEHLTLLALLPVTHSDQHVVYEQLQQTVATTGVPRAILGDHGSDLQAGVRRFCLEHPDTSNLYDVAHKAATLLKSRLERDELWAQFRTRAAQTKFQTQQTEWAFLVPPAQRSKARYMNLEPLLNWAARTLRVLDEQPAATLRHGTPERLEEKFGWLREFRASLTEWCQWQTLTSSTIDEVRRHGYASDTAARVTRRLSDKTSTPSGVALRDELIAFVTAESTAARADERLPGSSEILESALGQLKSLEGDHQKGGFTGLLLSLGALVGRLDATTIGTALRTTPCKLVPEWLAKHFRQTLNSKRRETYTPNPRSAPIPR
jgi:hypothetical protein